MNEYLIFRLYGPMASWGEVAIGGEQRSSANRPTRSAVLGMVASALGIQRSDEKNLNKLETSLAFAVVVEAEGVPMEDYHTVQTGESQRGDTVPLTRKDELKLSKQHTILSTRQYRYDATCKIALWQKGNVKAEAESGYALQQIAEALKSPAFIPFLGRRSCPVSLPFEARIVSADSVRDAFFQVQFQSDEWLKSVIKQDGNKKQFVYWDASEESGFQKDSIVNRRDSLVSRERWQYQERSEARSIVK